MPEPAGPEARSTAELTAAASAGLRWVAGTRVAVEGLMLVGMVVLARLLPPSAFGVFAIVVIVQELAVGLPSEGIGAALVQRREVTRDHLRAGATLSLLLGGALALVTVAVALVVVGPLYGAETRRLVLLATPCCALGALAAVPFALLRRRLAFARIAMVELAATLVRLVVTVVLAACGLDATALVLGFLAGSFTTVALGWASARVPPPGWRRAAVRDLLPYGGPAALASLTWAGFRNGDYAVVNAQLGPAQAGFYFRSYQLSVEYQKKLGAILGQMAFPVLARTGDAADLEALRHRMARGITVVVFPALVLLVVLAPVLVPWLFGPRWAPAVLPAQVLAAGGAATLLIDAVAPALMAAGRSRSILAYGVGHFAAYLGGVLLVAAHGLVAVAAVAAVVHGAFALVAYGVLLRRPGAALRALWADVAPATAACVPLAAVAWAADRGLAGLEAPVPVRIGAVALAGALTYLGALRVVAPAAAADLGTVLRRLLPARRVRGGPGPQGEPVAVLQRA